MKGFLAIAMAALMVLSFVSVASAEPVEVRGEVTDLATFTWDANNFAGFWIDIDTGEFSETLELTNTAGDILDGDLVYTAVGIPAQEPEFEFTVAVDDATLYEYTKVGFLAEEYFAVDGDVATLSKVLLDDDTSYTLRTGESLELEEGYAVTPKQIDVDGNKVWLEITKDGDFVEDKILTTNVDEAYEKTWYYEMELNDIEDVAVVMIHVDQVFQGQVDSLCIIDGIFQISDDPTVIEDDDEFGELTVTSVDPAIVMINDDNELDMPDDDTLAITDTLGIAANEDTTLWYLYTEYTEPGTYEIRGELTDLATFTWDANNFAGFWLDIDTGEFSETVTLINTAGDILDGDLVYTAVGIPAQEPEFEFTVAVDDATLYEYTKVGFLAEEYFAVDDDVATLSKVLLDDDTSYTLRTGESLELEEGYAVTPKQIDVDGNKVWLEITKDGDFVEDKILTTNVDEAYEKTWYYEMELNDIEDVAVVMIHVDQVFQGQVDSLCVIDGIFQISDDPLVIEDDDEFGELTVTSVDPAIVMINDDNELDMPDDDTLAITDELGIAGNEDTTLWYLYTEKTIEGDMDEEPVDEVEEPVEEPVDENVTEPVDENVTEPVDENVTEPVDEVEEPVDEPVPGFEAVFAIAGLLAVAYFVRRN
ncbi:S-layer protein domain-containing protein [Methanococcoides sp. NM1]|uniref:S-layer protein domain-containing protein n=1 Tax=Methanococcoides sp. NM1 TaxID=1201013 RepID=UPI00108332CD|nr:S-layer protein domain-containing protein [Methanococcoides sp. NM1]